MTKTDFKKIYSHEKDIVRLRITDTGVLTIRNIYNPDVTYKFVDGSPSMRIKRADIKDFRRFLAEARAKRAKDMRGIPLYEQQVT